MAAGAVAAPGLDAAPPRALTGLLLVPAIAASICFMMAPLAVIVINSVTDTVAGTTTFTLKNFTEVVTDSYYWEVMLRTLRIALVTTAVTLLFAYPAALYVYFSQSRWRSVFMFIVISPLFVSVIVRTYGWIVLLSGNGALNAVLPSGYETRLLRTETAVVLGLMHVYMPFMVLALHAALVKVDRNLLNSAAVLGASNLRIFRDIVLPLSLPGILSGCMIVFAISMTAFSTPVLLGGAANKTLPFLIYQQNLVLSNWHLGSAIAFVLLAVTLLGVSLLRRAVGYASSRTVS